MLHPGPSGRLDRGQSRDALRRPPVLAEAGAMIAAADVGGLAVALGVGLLIGIERERRKGDGAGRGSAGLRTFALVALAGALAAMLGSVALAVGGAFTVLAALAAWRRGTADDPGLTTEFAMLVAFLLGVLAMREPALAAGTGVLVALLLATKTRLHRFVREALTEQELHDALLLAAAATIVLPLLPDRAVDPWQVLNPRRLWLLAVIVMAINAAGHVALRLLGTRWGLLLAGLAGGFASSTATTAAMGALARRDPPLATTAACAGALSSVSTVVQLALVVAVVSPALLARIAAPLAAAGVAILLFSARAVWRDRAGTGDAQARIAGRAFEPRHALVFVGVVAGVLLLAAAARQALGDAGLAVALALSGLADVHAAAVSAAQLVDARQAPLDLAATGLALAFAANTVAKAAVAFAVGGRRYGLRLLPGLALMVAAFAATLALAG